MTLGPRPAAPGDREEGGCEFQSLGPQSQEEEGGMCRERQLRLWAAPGLHPLQGRGRLRISGLAAGMTFPFQGRSPQLPIPHCAPVGPGGRAGNGSRTGQNEKQLREGGAGCLGGRIQLRKQWLPESAAAAVVPRQALSREAPAHSTPGLREGSAAGPASRALLQEVAAWLVLGGTPVRRRSDLQAS